VIAGYMFPVWQIPIDDFGFSDTVTNRADTVFAKGATIGAVKFVLAVVGVPIGFFTFGPVIPDFGFPQKGIQFFFENLVGQVGFVVLTATRNLCCFRIN
jgi:hypothetical protein